MTRRTRYQQRCHGCDLLFPSLSPVAIWCSEACRRHVWRQRKRQPTAPVVQPTVFEDCSALPPAWQPAPAPIVPVSQRKPTMPFAFEGQRVRVITDDEGLPWFVAADVCAVLGMGNPTQALSRLDDDEKTLISNEGQGRREAPTMNAVNEPGLYALVLGSRKPEARRFKRWVTHEVLPTIRGTGRYGIDAAPQQALPKGVHVVASSRREAAQIWWDTIRAEVTSALAERLSPTHRHDHGLPLDVNYSFQQLSLMMQP